MKYSEDSYRKLALFANRGGEVREIVQLLTSLENAYNNLYALDFLIKDAERYRGTKGEPNAAAPIRTSSISDVEGLLLPEDRLKVTSIVIQSPGFFEFLGALNPLEQIREFINLAHEHRKDREYREQHDNERLKLENERHQLENEKLKTEILRERIALLKDVGFEPEVQRRLLIKYAITPLSQLDQHVNSGLISGASIEDVEDVDHKYVNW